MDARDSDMPTPKRPRLDSVNALYNGYPPPQPAHPTRHLSHPTPIHANSPPPTRHHYTTHSLPPPLQSFSPGPGHYHPPPQQPSTSLPPSDIRNLTDPTNIPHRVHGLPGTPVTHSPRGFPPDSISTYRPSHTTAATPQPTSAPDLGPSRTASASEETKPSMAHASWHGNQDHRNGGSISNGYPTAMSPPQHESSFQTPPLPAGQHYAPPSAGGFSPASYMGSQYAQGPGQMRRKQVRATQACNHCRSRKQKCDEQRPCQFCREQNFDCQYKDVPVPKQDRSMMQIQESINSISDTLKDFVENFNVWKQSVEGRIPQTKGEHFMSTGSMDQPSPEGVYSSRNYMSEQRGSGVPTPIQPRSQISRVNSMKTESPIGPYSHTSPVPAQMPTPVKRETMSVAPQQPATPAYSIAPSQSSRELKVPEGIQSDHTTPAHMLLPQWATPYNLEEHIPALKKLIDHGKPITDYPMYYEQERGLLRIWGVGEGQDYTDGVQGVASPGSLNDSDTPSPASTIGKDNSWGYPSVDQFSPNTIGSDFSRHYESPGGLGPDGKPDFRISTLHALHASYMQHIHVLHPFLNPFQLDKMIDQFSKVYSPEHRASHAMSPSGVPDRLNPGLKRKRSSSMFGDGFGSSDDISKGSIERTLRNAIVLLVLALGKVSSHKGMSLPSPQVDRGSASSGLLGSASRDSPRSANSSFRSEDADNRQRNVDILPGMAYFSHATDILGYQQAGNTVAHAQAMVLAALYLAQFGRVIESWSYIHSACRISLVLVKADHPRINRDRITRDESTAQVPAEPDFPPKERHRLNLVKIIYWTCLSLETDILAEMSTLAPTQVSRYQSEIMYPAGVYEHVPDTPNPTNADAETDLCFYIYSSLIHLRVLLNGAHNSLYNAAGNPNPEVFKTSQTMAQLVKEWRNVLPPMLAWDNEQSPSNNLNIARLRAKVYGALYIVLRPCLFDAMHKFKTPTSMHASFGSSPASTVDTSTSTPNAASLRGNMSDLDKSLIDVSHECIESAIQSTIAFDRVGALDGSEYRDYISTRTGRLNLTNIVGTLHAQFGNMIVLAAVYKSPLMYYLPKETPLTRYNLSRLFHRTMNILDEWAPNSPILRIDYQILGEIKAQMDLQDFDHQR